MANNSTIAVTSRSFASLAPLPTSRTLQFASRSPSPRQPSPDVSQDPPPSLIPVSPAVLSTSQIDAREILTTTTIVPVTIPSETLVQVVPATTTFDAIVVNPSDVANVAEIQSSFPGTLSLPTTQSLIQGDDNSGISSTTIIVGGAVGATVFIVAVVALAFFIRSTSRTRRERAHRRQFVSSIKPQSTWAEDSRRRSFNTAHAIGISQSRLNTAVTTSVNPTTLRRLTNQSQMTQIQNQQPVYYQPQNVMQYVPAGSSYIQTGSYQTVGSLARSEVSGISGYYYYLPDSYQSQTLMDVTGFTPGFTPVPQQQRPIGNSPLRQPPSLQRPAKQYRDARIRSGSSYTSYTSFGTESQYSSDYMKRGVSVVSSSSGYPTMESGVKKRLDDVVNRNDSVYTTRSSSRR